jgi:hypothetical protein
MEMPVEVEKYISCVALVEIWTVPHYIFDLF